MSNQEIHYLIKNELQYLVYNNPKNPHINKKIFNKYKNIILNTINFLSTSAKFNEILYCYINNIKTNVLCLQCNKKLKFQGYSIGYNKYCSISCGSKHTQKNVLKTILKTSNFIFTNNKKLDFERLRKITANRCSSIYYNHYEKEIIRHNKKFSIKNINEMIYRYINDIDYVVYCKNCGIIKMKFLDFNKGYSNFCSPKCRLSYDDTSFISLVKNMDFKFSGDIKKDFYRLNEINSYCPKGKILYSFYKEQIESINFVKTINEKIYCLLNDIHDIPRCLICNKKLKYFNFKDGFGKFCSTECSDKGQGKIIYESIIKKLNYKFTNNILNDIKNIDKIKTQTLISTLKIVYDHYKEQIDKNTSFLNDSKYDEKLYCYINNITEKIVCKQCGNYVKFNSFKDGYRTFC